MIWCLEWGKNILLFLCSFLSSHQANFHQESKKTSQNVKEKFEDVLCLEFKTTTIQHSEKISTSCFQCSPGSVLYRKGTKLNSINNAEWLKLSNFPGCFRVANWILMQTSNWIFDAGYFKHLKRSGIFGIGFSKREKWYLYDKHENHSYLSIWIIMFSTFLNRTLIIFEDNL